MKRLLLLAIIGAALAANAQNWSAPVAVTTGAGDDHHTDIAYDWYENRCWMAWDRTDSGNTDIYARSIDFAGGQWGEQIRLTTTPSMDEKPSVVHDLWENGIIYQSNLPGAFGIYYIQRSHEGQWLSPWLSLTSSEDLLDAIYAPMISDVVEPGIFFHSDSSAQFFYGFGWEIPINETYNISVPSQYPVNANHGYFETGDILSPAARRWVWEYSTGSISQVGYSCWIRTWMFQGITYEGTVPFGPGTLGHHLPVIDDLNIYLECEQDSDYDIVCTTLDTAYGGFPDPQTIFDDMGNEKNPDVLSGNLVFETDVNGNWDIAYWCSGMDMPELIDSDPAEDRNPMIYLSDYPNAGLHVFWESRRDGSWKIYYSHRDILGIGPERKGSLPGSLALSVHPNPGNAEFHIDLELPVSGEVEAAIYDLSGRRVARIHEGWMGRGLHDLTWNAQRFPSAIYLLQVESGKYHQTRKVVLLK